MNFKCLILTTTFFAAAALPLQAQTATPDVAATAADPAAAAAAIKAQAKQMKEWKRQYGEGPYPGEVDAFVSARNEPLRPYYTALYTGGERNSVLNLSRLGLAAMELGQWKDAERAFDAALLRIETVYAKDGQAQAARSIWHKEANKDWKGEPYERAMAYYYRGILYLRKGDYNNARAAFKGAEYQDTVSESEEFQSDFALMNYLTGWSSKCAGDNGDLDFEAALKTQTGLTAPANGDNVVMIAELGHGPLKARDGVQKEKLVFRAAEGFPETGATFILTPAKGAAKRMNGLAASSVYYQATTRGGRAMDGILDGKASWKTNTAAIGSTSTNLGLQMMNGNFGGGGGNAAGAGAALAVAGLMFSAFSSAVKTDADIRQWDSLPDGVALSTAAVAGNFTSAVAYSSAAGPMELAAVPIMQASSGKCSLVWTRSRSALLSAETPGDDPKVRAAVAKKKDVQLKDKAFRTNLETSFGS